MATAYPSAIDDFDNPLPTDSLDSNEVPHATQHSDANDAINAIETTLGVNPQGDAADVTERLGDIETAVGDLETTVDAEGGLTDRVGALETTIDAAETGLVARVDDLEDTVNDETTGLVTRVGALEDGLGDTPFGSALALVLSQVKAEATDEMVAGDTPGDVDDSAIETFVRFFIGETEYAIPLYAIVQAPPA